MKKLVTLVVMVAVLLVLPWTVGAAPVGKITHLEGRVDLTVAGGQAGDAKLGDPVKVGDILRAKSKSRAEITFQDGNILRLAENTRLRITDYQPAAGKTSTVDLFRGKTQSIVSNLAKNARYEVRTPTAVAGVRGTNFIAFFQGGVSGFVPKEGTIYGFNRNRPQEVKVVTPGQAIVVVGANQPPTVQPSTSMEVEKHITDTAPGEKKKEEKKPEEPKAGEGGSGGQGGQGGQGQSGNGEGGTTTATTAATTVATTVVTTVPLPPVPPPTVMTTVFTSIPTTIPTTIPPTTTVPPTTVAPTTGLDSAVTLGTATGRLTGSTDNATGTGTQNLTLNNYPSAPGAEVGSLGGTLSDGSGYQGYLASVPGSWMGAMSGIFYDGRGSGLMLGSLTGSSAAAGALTASGPLEKSGWLLGPGEAPVTDQQDLEPGVYGASVEANGAAYVASTPAWSNRVMQSAAGDRVLTAWGLDNVGPEGSFAYTNASSRTGWKAGYGFSGDGYSSFLVGELTGSELDPAHLRLSARNLLYISEGYMGTGGFEYWRGPSYSGGAGTLDVRPLAFGGYWGYNMAGGPYCLLANNLGYGEHVGDDWGLIGAWSAPWSAPAAIKLAGTFQMDEYGVGLGTLPGYLWESPVSRRGYAEWIGDFADGDFLGMTVGAIGRFAPTADGPWQRTAKGALAALYVKDGQAGFLTTFAPRSAQGGLAGAYHPEAQEGDWGYWRMEGNLTARTLASVPAGGLSLLEADSFAVRAGYDDGSAALSLGDGYQNRYSFYPTAEGSTAVLPWGVYSLGLEGVPQGEGISSFSVAAGRPADLSGKAVPIGFGSTGTEGYWLGELGETLWTPTVAGTDTTAESGEIAGFVAGEYLTPRERGTFGGPFFGLYDEDGPGSGRGTWIGQNVGTYEGALLAMNGNVSGSLKRFACPDGCSLALTGSTSGLLGSTTNPFTASAELLLMGSYTTDAGYQEPALMYGSGWYLGGEIGIDPGAAAADRGTHNGYLIGLWSGGKIEQARLLHLYARQDGTAGYLYGDATGAYFPGIGMWKATGDLAHVQKSAQGSGLDARFDTVGGSFDGAVGKTAAGYSLASEILEGATLGLVDQAPAWGIWNMGLGGSYTETSPATVPAAFTAPAGGTLTQGQEAGYWVGDLNLTWGATPGRLSATLTNGRFQTDRQLGVIATGAEGGILGSYDGQGLWQAAGVGTYAGTETLAFSSRIDGQLSKLMTGTFTVRRYSGLYRLAGDESTDHVDFTVNGQQYRTVGYEAGFFADALGEVNRGFRFENRESLNRVLDGGVTRIYEEGGDVWYWPNRSFFVERGNGKIKKIKDRGRAVGQGTRYPNLNLSELSVTGGQSGNHPYFPGTVLGDPAAFAANYTIVPGAVNGHGTFVRISEYSFADMTSQEEIGTFTGLFGMRGSDPTALWRTATAALPASFSLMGRYQKEGLYTDIQGMLGFGSTLSHYQPTATGGGAYYGQLFGRLPDRGATQPFQGGLYALYVYTDDTGLPATATNRAGILYGELSGGSTYPEIGMWAADGDLYRLRRDPGETEENTVLAKDLIGDNPAAVTAANLVAYDQQGAIDYANSKLVEGRAGVEATAGFYNPAGKPVLALGMGYGKLTAIQGVNKFGLFSLNHSFASRYENPTQAGVPWESSGWGEFGAYGKGGSFTGYMDEGYWYATLDNRSWGGNRLAADFNGTFLTFKKYGTMTGQTSGGYDDQGHWSAGSQGYWTKDGDLGFAAPLQGRRYDLVRRDDGSYSAAGGQTYAYATYTRKGEERSGESEWRNATGVTFTGYDTEGPQEEVYRKETWQTDATGATWSYTETPYADQAAYRTALDGITTPPSGYTWTPEGSGQRYELWRDGFDGILGGLNPGLWADRLSGLKFQGLLDMEGRQGMVPFVTSSDFVSLNPLVSEDPYFNAELAIGGAFMGKAGWVVDSANGISGGLMALYQGPLNTALEVPQGHGGVLYSDDMAGTFHPAVGAWLGEGTLTVYPMTGETLAQNPQAFAQTVRSTEIHRNYEEADHRVGVENLTLNEPNVGPTVTPRAEQMTRQQIADEPWGIWHSVRGGTYTGDEANPARWIERLEGIPDADGAQTSSYASVQMGAPVKGVATGNLAGAEARFAESPTAVSHTVVMGGVVKGLFDPATTPAKSWMAIAQGGAMETGAFLNKVNAMDAAARANFERAMKIPAFDVGTANLSGNNANLYVNMDGIKFFRFQNETDPRIWATSSVYGSYTTNPTVGTTVPLTSSGGLTGLTHTFEVRQWNTSNNNWGATISRGSGSGGTLTRTDGLGTGSVSISEMRGAAAGTMTPLTNNTGLPGSGSFSGTAAGTVKVGP